jgi:flagellar basal-body rod modification protein FlgD
MATVNNIINGLTNNATSTSTAATTKKKDNTLGQDEFMTMLLAQLKNQDPLNPMDGKDFAAQLAQFSTLQQITNLNTTMSSLPTYLQSLSNSQMANMIGANALAKGNVINVSGATTNISYTLPADIQSGTIKIYNTNGAQVDTLSIGSQKAGINTTSWNSSYVGAGNYTFAISAVDQSNNAVSASTLISGKITGVSFKNNNAYLTINGQDVAFADVSSISAPSN